MLIAQYFSVIIANFTVNKYRNSVLLDANFGKNKRKLEMLNRNYKKIIKDLKKIQKILSILNQIHQTT